MNSPSVITLELVDGTRVVVPDSLKNITSYVLREQGDWFEDEIKFLRRVVQAGDTVLDIGANYGVYALSLARKVGPTGRVWAFEPASDTAKLLTESSTTNATTWLRVVQKAISDREGNTWLQKSAQPEGNKLAGRNGEALFSGAGEAVDVTTLDHCLDAFGWERVDLVKIDAEGEEERIISGGARFFRELSPLVMFEVKEADQYNLGLVQKFDNLGYQCFRLIPGINALAPFSFEQGVDDFLLNLFAAKPERAAALAAAGWMVQDWACEANAAADIDTDNSLTTMRQMPYAQSFMDDWQSQESSEEQRLIQRALALWIRSQDGGLPLNSRYAALMHSFRLLQQQSQPGCPLVRWASLARLAQAVGERSQAVEALDFLLMHFEMGHDLGIVEPFLCPDPAFTSIQPYGSLREWLEAAALMALETLGAFSGYYMGIAARPRLERVAQLGYQVESLQRRLILVRECCEGNQTAAGGGTEG